MNEITDLLTYLKRRRQVSTQQSSKEQRTSLTPKQEQIEKVKPQPLKEEKVSTQQNNKNILKGLTQKQYNGDSLTQNIDPELLDILRDDIWIKEISVAKNTVSKKNKTYYYIRKRVELPRDFNEKYAVIMRRTTFVKLIKYIAKKLEIGVNEEKIQELLNM